MVKQNKDEDKEVYEEIHSHLVKIQAYVIGEKDMTDILLKETVMKLMESIVPRLFRQRFEEQVVMEVTEAYIEGKQTE